ncbi:uncharacterized protein LOC129906680 isoform X4 [Episyrphus balteatus]|uniref:uncharacterized protein LOC129906680 isoform X4 n=1 Tax=Episyrphus balteatus TaxID=286459 RepID=UPI002484FD37|nr:uncharacterized protein LOC129906680 isoform X4 [Episyrphus balteatus]
MPPKRKKRFHGLYYHSSPPRVLPMNAQAPVETKKKSADDFSIRLSTIRIWMHEKDIGKLTRVLWAGQGNRLRQQASTNPKVKRFLAAVPYVMNSIKDVHQSVVDNSLETLQATMESNVPPTLITCKDANGLNVIHKAAGLGHYMMLEYLLSIWPDGAHETDMTGKTALHWAASAKNNMRCYTLLTQAGCEEDALDYKMKTPLYYKQKHNEIERSFLTQVPEAPRVSQDIPVDWEALASDDSDDRKKPDIIIPNGRRKSDILGNSVNLLTSRSEANSIENTSEPDLFQGDNTNDEHHEPQIEEPKSNDDTKNPLENGHMTNSEVEISESEPASPPETPEETQEEEETQNEEEELEEKEPEKLSEDEERYIEAIINSGDMEQLAALVLNGDGKKILNRKSSKPEIQAFLTNVPAYMDKISRVHEAARQGTLYQLQAALDRRKFAIAKDEMSPCGASPLHVGVLFGHSDIVRYLAGRFPETTSAVDDDGRTALHYAATINDNGHFFNLLSHLGGNPKATDKLGNTAEFYMNDERAKNVLTYRQLLKRFGAETLEDEMLSDQVPDDLHSSRRNMLDMDVATTLERCFSVIQESSKCLSSATASAIATQRRPRSASSQPLTVTSYLGKFLRRSVFDKIKKRQTRLDHNLFDVIWPAMRKTIRERRFDEDLNLGVIAPDYDVYVVFQEFLVPLIKDIHCLNISSDFKPHPRIAYFPIANGERMTHLPFVLNDESKLITQCSIECSRNLEGLELPLNLNVAQIEQAERAMMGKIFTTNFAKAIGDKETGSYYTLNEVIEENSVILKMLQDAGLLIPDLEVKDRAQEAECLAYNGQLWPYGRGVFVNAEQNLALWLNCQEHLRIISSTGRLNAPNIGMIYSKVGRAVTYLETQLHFKESYLLGYLAARPHFLGTGLKMTTTIQLPNLIKEVDNLRHLCSVRGLLMMSSQLKNSVRLVNMQSLGAIELLLFKEYCTAVTNIISLEKDMSLTNSKHIASMLVKIFRRKKDTLVDRT